MFSKFIQSLVKNFRASSADLPASFDAMRAKESFELGCRVAKFEESREGDYFDIRNAVYESIDNFSFDIDAFQEGSRSVRGHGHDLGVGDMFRIGQYKWEQLISVGRIVPQEP